MSINLIALFLQNIPETLALILLSLSFLGKKYNFKRVLFLGVIGGIFIYILRRSSVTPGVHTILFLMFLTLGIYWVFKTDFMKTLLSVIGTFIVLLITEQIMIFIYIQSNLLEKAHASPLLKSLLMVPQIIVLISLALLLYKYKSKKE
ncbi:MAG: hypothetical protein ACOCQW_00640 [Halanaerobiaceae bacterium]